MKNIILFILVLFSLRSGGQTLFKYGPHKVEVNEFLKAFQKNQVDTHDPRADMEAYLPLYINYRLKVQDAKDHHLDTMLSIRADLQSFRYQLEESYRYDADELKRLTGEALQRSKKDIRVGVYIIRQGRDMAPGIFKQLAGEVKLSLEKHDKAATARLKDKGVEVLDKELGFITVFSLPYDLENVIYILKPGTFSDPVFLNGSYWIFENQEERPAAGKIKIAQILLTPAPGDSAMENRNRQLADSLYEQLQKGADFSSLAERFSSDRNTYHRGGEMPVFGVGQYSPVFEDHAFGLKNPGDISRPFKTIFGYHILKLISAVPVSTQDTTLFKSEISMKLMQDDRLQLAAAKMIEKAKQLTGFHDYNLPRAELYKITDSSLFRNLDISAGVLTAGSSLFGFNDGTDVSIRQWTDFLKRSHSMGVADIHGYYDDELQVFRSQVIRENYLNRLSGLDSDFAAQLADFNDGNMLFEMMQQKVWTKASGDSEALQKYYRQNTQKYKWERSVAAVTFYCNNEETARKCMEELKTRPWREVLESNATTVQADSGRFEITQLHGLSEVVQPGVSGPTVDQYDNSASFVQVLQVFDAGMQRAFIDARGLVIEDYQKVLEQKWIDELRRKYPVKINRNVWETVLSKVD